MGRFAYDKDDPSKSEVMKGDPLLAYLKFERKTNHKAGIYDCLALFENRFNFEHLYRVFIHQGSFIHEQLQNLALAKNSFVEDIQPVDLKAFSDTCQKHQA
jgi:hypothetical protein